jgi:hypothetical protein
MQSDQRAAPAYKALPRLLERVNETEPANQRAFVSVPTEKMTRAALLNGWPVNGAQRVELTGHCSHSYGRPAKA